MALPYKRSDAKTKNQKPTVVIRRVRKVVVKAHHGGAWKVAYADFVTAMMAFFLLLWLISTSSEATVQGISEYFTPVSGLDNNRPIGTNNASPTMIDQKDPGINLSSPGVAQDQAGNLAGMPDNPAKSEGDEAEEALFQRGADAISQMMETDPTMGQYKDNIQVTQTPEGLRIDLKDAGKYPMFVAGSTQLTEHGQTILARLTALVRRMPNYMSFTGYTDGSVLESDNLQRWEISAGRAQAALKFMTANGLEPERPLKVQGLADTETIASEDPRSGRDRRITLLMLRGSHILIPNSAVPGTP
jgi:chemotaxis protein MotB